MENLSRFLVTTSDQRTWKLDRPLIFLGEWCRLHDQRHIWQNLDIIVANPYGLDLATKIFDYQEVRSIEKKLLLKASAVLNEVHGKMYSERFWKIVIGHWLRTFIQVGLNRYKTIKKCIEENQISGSTFVKINDENLIALDFNSFVDLINNPAWTSSVDLKIISLIPKIDFSIESIIQSEENFIKDNYHSKIKSYKKDFKSEIFNLVKNSLRYCVRDTDAMITNTYLPRVSEIKLNLALGQLPQFWDIETLKVLATADLKLRNELKSQFIFENGNSLLKILSTFFFDLLPLAYLEGFVELQNLSQNKNFPKFPKFIFTSNNFQGDEIFKVWTANQTEMHTKYFVGQHGVNYGTHRFNNPPIEVETADTFLAFGEQKPELNYRESFLFKTLNKKITFDPHGALLFVAGPIDDRRNTWDSTLEHHQLFNHNLDFLSKVKATINPDLIVRLHPLNESIFPAGLKYHEFDPSLKIDKGYSKLESLVQRSRLVVFSYESTGIIENLYLDIPTMALFLNGFDYLADEAKIHYKLLEDVGIFHVSAESAAQKICIEWGNIRNWWDDPILQSARVRFCNQYGKKSRKPIKQLRKIFNEGLK